VTHSVEETLVAPSQEMLCSNLPTEASVSKPLLTTFSKDEIRTSLHASTLDGVFATLFSTITGGVLLNNFLVELNASSFQIGMLASIPMVVNLLQPIGAHWADRTTSRCWYGLWIYGISRLLWMPLAIAIIIFSWHPDHPQQMIAATLVAMLATHALGALGSASWLSWLAALVPRKLRGRYFGFRNSAFSLTGLIALPMLGVAVSRWPGGSIQGFGVMVIVAVIAGLISLSFQFRMTDINPQTYCIAISKPRELEPVTPSNAQPETITTSEPENKSENPISAEPLSKANLSNEPLSKANQDSLFENSHFLLFLLYFGIWAFGMNLSNPFFNLYLLDNLSLDVSWVTLYNSLGTGANLLMLLVWGKLADRIGNRSILLLDGVLVAIIPLLWLGTDASTLSMWVWFPLLHLFGGGVGAALELCTNNLQLAIAPAQHYTKYFAITAAIGGVTGALGALMGGWLAQLVDTGGILGLFALSSVLRLIALLPLVWIQEPQRRSLRQILKRFIQPAQGLNPSAETATKP
jgi:MFS family permease